MGMLVGYQELFLIYLFIHYFLGKTINSPQQVKVKVPAVSRGIISTMYLHLLSLSVCLSEV